MKISRVLSVAFISVALAGAGFAADTKEKSTAPSTPSTTTTTKAANASNEHRFRGSVSALDAKAATLKVKSSKEEKAFTVGDKAKASFAKVKVGDRVRITYADEGGKLVVHSLSDSTANSEAKSTK